MSGDEPGVIAITQRELLLELREDIRGLKATVDAIARDQALGVERRAAMSRTPTTAESLAFLEDLPRLWAETSDAGRHAIAEATFERVDVLGVTDYTFTLTAHAKAHGWDLAFGAAAAG